MPRTLGSKVRTGKNNQKKDARQRAWSCMRILGKFDINQICSISGIGIDNVRRFEKKLRDYGYTQIDRNYRGGRVGEFMTIRLIKNTGPLRPVIGNTGTLYDQNFKKFVEKGENNGTGKSGVVGGVEGGLPQGQPEQNSKTPGRVGSPRQPGIKRLLCWES